MRKIKYLSTLISDTISFDTKLMCLSARKDITITAVKKLRLFNIDLFQGHIRR